MAVQARRGSTCAHADVFAQDDDEEVLLERLRRLSPRAGHLRGGVLNETNTKPATVVCGKNAVNFSRL
jgi:hypothetical protein